MHIYIYIIKSKVGRKVGRLVDGQMDWEISWAFLLELQLHISICKRHLKSIMCKTKLKISPPTWFWSFSSVLNQCEQVPIQLVTAKPRSIFFTSPVPLSGPSWVLVSLSPKYLLDLFIDLLPLPSSSEPPSCLTWTTAVISYLVYLHFLSPSGTFFKQ